MDERTYFNPEMETLPRERLRELQQARLLNALPLAYQRAALLRRRWDEAGVHPSHIRSLDDFLARAPTLDKDMVRDYRDRHGDPFGGMAVDLDERYEVGSSSGTTGSPTLHPINERDTSLFADSLARHFWCAGARPGTVVSLAAGTYLRPFHALVTAARRTGARIVYADWMDVPRILHHFRFLEPALHVFLTPPQVVGMREELARTGDDLRELLGGRTNYIWGGDALTPRTREHITAQWGGEVFELSGTADLCYMMMECEQHDGLHAHDDLWHVEVVEPGTTRPVAEGERGEFLYTALMDSSLAYLRWRSEDIGYMDTAPCACGRTSTRLYFLGRVGYRANIRDQMIFPLDIQRVLEVIPEADHGLFQIVKSAEHMERLHLRVGYRPQELPDPGPLGERIVRAIDEALGLPAEVAFVHAEELLALGPPHKIPRIHEARERK